MLHKEQIDRLLEQLTIRLPKISIQASCADGLSRAFENRDEFDSFPNSERSAITELRIRATNLDDSFEVIMNNDDRSNVRMSLSADNAIGMELNEIYEDFISGMQPWYRWIAAQDWVLVTMILALIVMFGLGIASWLRTHTWPEMFPPTTGKGLLSAMVGFSPLVVGLGVRKIRRKFFPMGAFALGDGKKRHENCEVWRTVVILGFAVSILSSVVLSWFV